MANSVKIRIDGDASGYKNTLDNIAKQTKVGMADVKAGIDLATGALQKLQSVASKGINYNATIEFLQTSFEVMTGSAEKAAEVVERLRVMGAETPFETQDLVSTTQLLMQYGFTADDAIEKTSMLGDIAQGNAEKMNSVALGYAQMSSASKVNLVDIKQMINAGFNPLQEISERTGESMASLYDRISKGTMKVEEITQSMVHATSEGGRFFQSMEKQSQTLNGQLSTLKDNADQLLGSLTEGLSEGLRDELLPFANNMIGELQTAFEQGGVQGLTDAATDMIPNLLDMMSGELETGLNAIGKWLPKGASAIMKHVPNALRSASNIAPQITNSLFEVATVVVTDLGAMLPELIPIFVDGFGNMLVSSLQGIDKLITGFFNGIEQAFHKGQKKSAGIWVDETAVAKYTFGFDADITSAKTAIETAYSEIRAALQTDLLTEEQRAEIEGMIGDDYNAIYAKLKSFGLSDSDANTIATQVTTASDTIKAEIDKLNVGVDSETVLKWMAQAGGSRLRLKGALKKAGLSESDIAEITTLYDTMLGRVADSTPSIVEEIYNKLTDGAPDDQQTVDTLKGKIESYINGLLTQLETTYATKSAELDTTAADYEEKKAVLDAWYRSTKAEITGLNSNMNVLVATLAGAPTTVVQSKLEQFALIEEQLFALEEKIDILNEKARTAAENAFAVVRSGANADEATISQAVNLKFTEFKLDTQAAEDAYNLALEELNAQLANKEITQEEYDTNRTELEAEKKAAIQAAKDAYEQALREIFTGIAESEGTNEAIEGLADKLNFATALQGLSDELSNLDPFTTIGDSLGEDFTTMLAEYMQISPEELKNKTIPEVKGAIDGMLTDTYSEIQDGLEGADSTKLQEAYKGALESGVLEGTTFFAEGEEAELTALFSSMYANAAVQAASAAEEAGGALVESAETGGEGSETAGTLKGSDYGSGYVDGIRSWANAAYSAGYTLGKEAARGTADGQDSSSPSKVAKSLGGDFGEGYSIGLQESMARAATVARQLTGHIATSVDITQSMRVANMPNLSQEIAVANEQNKTPVYLDGVQIAEIQGHNNSTRLAWQNTKSAKGVGSR